jgi:hypothetical protein
MGDVASWIEDGQVVARIPWKGYTLLLGTPMVVVDAAVLTSGATPAKVLTMAALTLALVGGGAVWARAYLVLLGPTWLARRGLFGWRVAQLDHLARIRTYQGSGLQLWLHLHDTEGGHVAISAKSTVPSVRSVLLGFLGD